MPTPGTPFTPYPTSSVSVALGGVSAGSFQADALTAAAVADDAIHALAIAADARGQIKSIQRGKFTFTGTSSDQTATLSPAVVMAKTEVRLLGIGTNYGGAVTAWAMVLELTGTTSLRCFRINAVDLAGGTTSVSWEITERY